MSGFKLDLANLFTYHKPKNDQLARYEKLRAAAKAFAEVIDRSCPDGPDKTVAIRKVREAVMTANAAIACGEADVPEGVQ
jgi:hypothetical protein